MSDNSQEVAAKLRIKKNQTWEDWKNMYVVGLEGKEGLSELFEFQVTLFFDGTLDEVEKEFNTALGEPIELTLAETLDQTKVRKIKGIVGILEYLRPRPATAKDRHVLRATIVPNIWKLLQTSHNRIFSIDDATKKNLEELIDAVLKSYKAHISSQAMTGLEWIGGPRDEKGYRVQYDETDWAFLSRLLEEFGLFYCFPKETVSTGKDLIIGIADYVGTSSYACPKLSSKVISSFNYGQSIRPRSVSLFDYNPASPTKITESSLRHPNANTPSNMELREYPGGFNLDAQGKAMARVRYEEATATAMEGMGQSISVILVPGYTFQYTGDSTNSSNQSAFPEDTYLVRKVVHKTVNEFSESTYSKQMLSYKNSFWCIPSTVTYRPPRITPRPTIKGIQTAIVTAAPDSSGRVKVRFHWDGNSSCWIRVKQLIAGHGASGPNRGAQWFPRIGDEVIVDFINGDPDRPIVMGSVYQPTDDGGQYSPYVPTKSSKIKKLTGGLDQESTHWDDSGHTFTPDRFDEYVLGDKTMKVSNHRRNVIKDGATEISLVDEGAGKRVLRLQSRHSTDEDGDLVADADTLHLKCGDHFEDVSGSYRQNIGEGGLKRYTGGDFHHSVEGDYRLEVGGDTISYIGGTTKLAGDIKTHYYGANSTMFFGANSTMHHGKNTTFFNGLDTSLFMGNSLAIAIGRDMDICVGSKTSVVAPSQMSIVVGLNQSVTVGASVNIAVGPTVNVAGLTTNLIDGQITAGLFSVEATPCNLIKGSIHLKKTLSEQAEVVLRAAIYDTDVKKTIAKSLATTLFSIA